MQVNKNNNNNNFPLFIHIHVMLKRANKQNAIVLYKVEICLPSLHP